jgi:hypothetical protein
MKDCKCGKPVRLGAEKISVDRKRGVQHYIAHADGSRNCDFLASGAWICAAFKPYPANPFDREYAKLLRRWDAA